MGRRVRLAPRAENNDSAISGHRRISFEGLHQQMSAMMHNTDSGQRRSYALKRVFDVISSSVGLAILSPLLLLIATAILVDTGRPVFFMQERAGLVSRPFRVIKFIMTVQGADLVSFWKDAYEDSQLITRTGGFLRHWSLDELPEPLNVVRGEMNLVGIVGILG